MKQQMVPGFTAEQSLYRKKGKHFTAAAFEEASGNIEPTQIINRLGPGLVTPNLCPDCSQAFWFCPPPLPPPLPPGRCFWVCPLVACSSI
jgi:hypothetical protein